MKDKDAVNKLSALAHEDRVAAFRLLVKAGPEGLPSGEIASVLEIAPTRMSFHLSALERSGLVRARRNGRHVHYAVNYEDMRRLLVFLTEDCCGSAPEICRLPAPLSQAIPTC
ncbi:transcriptional regulator [Roseibium aquae]|uniref:Transcriptional regulator n=1 Tax=Roseibium aquae TaxID=1323746 RepID=A0A916T8U5_9HYPH|nr:metalloregulator ArsR/SmtB family transcription factor [Roseibium aquae]GGB36024.1 transcriptional regulator [Roseibium aquae]